MPSFAAPLFSLSSEGPFLKEAYGSADFFNHSDIVQQEEFPKCCLATVLQDARNTIQEEYFLSPTNG